MVFDELNINILSYLYINPNSTTSNITSNILDSKNTSEFRKNDSIIRYRLITLVKNGLVIKSNEKKAKYRLDEKFIVIGEVEGKSIQGILFLVDKIYPILIGFNKNLIKDI